MQSVFAKLSWQIVEVYHILIAEMHNLDDFCRVFVRQTAEQVFYVDR